MKFSDAKLSLLLCFFYTIVMKEPPTDNTYGDIKSIYGDSKYVFDDLKAVIEKFEEDVEKTLNSGTFKGFALKNIKTPVCYKDFVNLLNALNKINPQKSEILKDVADQLFNEYIDKNEAFNTPEDMINTYLKRLRTLQLISGRIYQIFFKTSETYEESSRVLCTHIEEIKMLIFLDKDIPEKAYEKIFNNENKPPSKQELASIQSRYFAKVSTESKIKDNKTNIQPDTTKKSTKYHHDIAGIILNSLDNELVKHYYFEFNANTLFLERMFSCLEKYLKKTQDKSNVKSLIEKFLKWCESELNFFKHLKSQIKQGICMNEIETKSAFGDILKSYQTSRKELLEYLEESNNTELKQLKHEIKQMQTNIIEKVFEIGSYRTKDVENIQINVAEGQIKRLENEIKYFRNLINQNQ